MFITSAILPFPRRDKRTAFRSAGECQVFQTGKRYLCSVLCEITHVTTWIKVDRMVEARISDGQITMRIGEHLTLNCPRFLFGQELSDVPDLLFESLPCVYRDQTNVIFFS